MAASDGLVEGEELVLRLHPHGKTLVRPSAILLLDVAVAIVVILVLPQSGSNLWPIRLAIGAAALLVALVFFGGPFLRWRTTTYEVTTRRLRLREGIVSRTGRDFPLNRISDVSFTQGVIDRMFGCGTLVVESPGEQGRLELDEIPEIRRVQGTLFQLVGNEASRVVWPTRPADPYDV
ncbi:MAG TPA: PH domain-containing protein [Streptosporangiaceae bacterium]|nr:PH domain-containing protein [Streptosporangiaceae bacterium]